MFRMLIYSGPAVEVERHLAAHTNGDGVVDLGHGVELRVITMPPEFEIGMATAFENLATFGGGEL